MYTKASPSPIPKTQPLKKIYSSSQLIHCFLSFYRKGGPPCQTILYEVKGTGKLTATTCLPVDSKYVKGSFKDKIMDETEDLDILNYSQIGLLIAHILLSLYEAFQLRRRNQPPPFAVPVPVVRAHRRNSDFAINIE